MLNSDAKYFKDKFYKVLESAEQKFPAFFERNKSAYRIQDLKAEILEGSPCFSDLCYSFARGLMPGKVSCTTYAACVVAAAKSVGVDYKVFGGFCLPRNSPQYASTKADFEKMKAAGKPMICNHVYVEIGGSAYELFNKETNNIDHIEVVQF